MFLLFFSSVVWMESCPRTEISRAGMSTNRLSRMLKRVQCTNMTISMKHSPLSGTSYLPISSVQFNFLFFFSQRFYHLNLAPRVLVRSIGIVSRL
ncbi:hypothetical protein B0T13DRAFT_27983 [Neurospora crassa]|nr:hypothetical protein B0T13DRAFT_27983 [Neurospora crassa]